MTRWLRLSARAFALATILVGVAAPARAGSAVEPSAPSTDGTTLGRDVPVLPAKAKAPDAPADLLVETHGFLRVVYHPSLFESVRRLVADASSVRASLAATVGQSVLEHVELRVARTPEEMAALSPIEAPPPARATGVAYPPLSLIVISHRAADGSAASTDDVFRHELAHLALAEAARHELPRWLSEGFAVQASGELAARRVQTLFSARLHGTLLSFADLGTFPEDEAAQRVAWAQSADFVRWLARGEGRARFAAALARVRSGATLDRALDDAYGEDTRGLEHRWREDLSHRYVTVPLVLATATGWALAIAAFWAVARRRRRKLARARRAERHAYEEREIVEAPEPRTSEPRLLVCDRGLGHVVYIVEGKSVPKVEHDGKRHTLH